MGWGLERREWHYLIATIEPAFSTQTSGHFVVNQKAAHLIEGSYRGLNVLVNYAFSKAYILFDKKKQVLLDLHGMYCPVDKKRQDSGENQKSKSKIQAKTITKLVTDYDQTELIKK